MGMTAYAAFLRAVNVGGTGKLAMSDLRALCEAADFQDVATYIQSGNVVFRSRLGEAAVTKALEGALAKKMGKAVAARIRSAGELAATLKKNPFPDAPPNRVLIFFHETPVPKNALEGVAATAGEEMVVHGRELFIHFPNGQGTSKLKIPLQNVGTGRNLNTVRKVLDMVQSLA